MATATKLAAAEETAAGIEERTAWWELGREDAAPEAVQVMYVKAKLSRDVISACERARKRMGSGYADYLRGLQEGAGCPGPVWQISGMVPGVWTEV